MSSTGRWVYAVGQDLDAACLRRVTGVGGGAPRLVGAAGLAAVTESVSLECFGDSALRRNLEDLDWLEAVARAHHRVIDAVAQHVQVVPVRLATVYGGDAAVRAMLADRCAEFRSVLCRTRGHMEWGVKAWAAHATAASDQPDSGRPGRSTPGSGAAYLRRRRNQLSAREQSQRHLRASVRDVHGHLAGLATAARVHPPQPPQLTDGRAGMVLNAAYLLPDEQSSAFRHAVRDLGGSVSLRLELTGPWPPYSFADIAAMQP